VIKLPVVLVARKSVEEKLANACHLLLPNVVHLGIFSDVFLHSFEHNVDIWVVWVQILELAHLFPPCCPLLIQIVQAADASFDFFVVVK